jgi:hypothetical protein
MKRQIKRQALDKLNRQASEKILRRPQLRVQSECNDRILRQFEVLSSRAK